MPRVRRKRRHSVPPPTSYSPADSERPKIYSDPVSTSADVVTLLFSKIDAEKRKKQKLEIGM